MFDILRVGAKSWLTRIIFGLIIIAFVFLGVGNFSQSSNTILAEVNGENISIHKFWRIYTQERETQIEKDPSFRDDKDKDKQLRVAILSQMIKERLQIQAAERFGIFVTPHELLKAVSQFTVFHDASGKFDPQLYEQVLKTSGQSPAQFENNFKRSILIEKLVNFIVSSVSLTEQEARAFFDFSFEERKAEYVLFANADFLPQVEVSEQEMQAYYDENKERFLEPARMNIEFVSINSKNLAASVTITKEQAKEYFEKNTDKFQQAEAYHVRHIFLAAATDETAGEDPKARAERQAKTINEINAGLKDGVAFEKLAQKHSEERSTGDKGGDMGWISKGELPVEIFEKTALGLEVGQVSEPFQSEFGTHIIKLEGKRAAGARAFAEVEETVKEQLALEQAMAQEEQIRQFAADELGKGTALKEIAATLNLPVKSTGLVPVSQLVAILDLPEAALRTLENIPVGETAPAPVPANDGIVLLRVEESTPERIPTLADIQEQIVDILKNRGAASLAEKAAKTALEEFASAGLETPKAFLGKTKVSDTFSRVMPMIQQFGYAPVLTTALASAPLREWLPQTFTVSQGVVIARVYSVTPVKEEFWNKEKNNVMQALLQDKQVNAVNAFLQNLVTKAKLNENMDLLFKL